MAVMIPEPDGEPESACDIQAISETMRKEVLQLQPAKDLATVLQRISLTLDEEPAPRDTMEAILRGLTELHVNVELAIGSPNDLPEPSKAGVVGEATLRARFGMTHLTEMMSLNISEQLAQSLSEVDQMQSAAQEVCVTLKELHGALTTYSAGISSAVKNLEVLQQRVEALADSSRSSGGPLDAATGPWKKALGLTAFAFEDLLRKLSGTQANLVPLAAQVSGRINKIQDFVFCADEDIRAAFQVPTPACFCQSLTIGKDPPMMRTMLDQVSALTSMNLDKVTEVLAVVIEDLSALRLERARNAVNKFAACAGGQLNMLDVLLVRAHLAERPIRRDEPPEGQDGEIVEEGGFEPL